MPDFGRLQAEISTAMLCDQFQLRRQLRSLRDAHKRGRPYDRNLDRFQKQLSESAATLRRRQAAIPAITYDESLPIVGRRADIAAAIADHQVVVVCGETGSGKSTQLPKICLEMGRGVSGLIGHTQPRRIAARSIAARLAEELGSAVGAAVGFKVRFTDSTSPRTLVKLMTDGILLAETPRDRWLEQYDTLIIDEAHERSLNIDFLLGYVKRLLPRRPDFRLIITSATIDAERFGQHFSNGEQSAPVLEVSGRSYPVEIRYRPPHEEDDSEDDPDLQRAVVDGVDELIVEGNGDVLVFLPTEREIRETARRLRGHVAAGGGPKTEILPLYARLSAAEQNKVFQPHRGRRIVLATNVAESSLTVPGIRYVIDTGTARISRYSPRSKVQRLPIEAVSRASADQRAGRCGRVAPGICIRLYGEDDFLGRDRYTTPEIRRTNLAAVILQARALKLGPLDEFPFLDPPNPEAVRDGYRTLFELGALDERRELTDIGRQLSRLPTDPRIARMILAADEEGCLAEVLIIAAALELQDPRERPVDKREAADQCHAQWADEESDFMTFLNLWDFFERQKEKRSRSQLRKACRQNFLSYNRMREWQDIHRQLRQLVEQNGMKLRKREDDYGAIHRALLTGLLANIGLRGDGYEYSGAGGKRFFLWPGSVVFAGKPQWIMSAELLETTRRYARVVARISPQWIEPLAQHLVKRSYSDPHWHGRSAAAMAFEKVTLFGVPIVARRRVAYGPIDPDYGRDLLIREGLVGGQLERGPDFVDANRRVVEELEALAARSRQRSLLVDSYRMVRFYDERLPAGLYDLVGLRKWWKKAGSPERQRVMVTQADLLDEEVDEGRTEQFPDELSLDGMQLPLAYRFEPGEADDGITVTVPRDAVARLQDDRLGWLVPGLMEEKVLALIRSLPKSIRRNLVPAPETARKVCVQLPHGEGPFADRVAGALSALAELPVRPADFQAEKLPSHLQMLVRVVAADGEVVAEGRDLNEIREQLGGEQPGQQAEIEDPRWQRDDLTAWDFGELPGKVDVARGGIQVPAFPALLDRGPSVSLRLLDTRAKAKLQTRRGIRRLFVIAARRDLREQVQWIPDWSRLAVMIAPVCPGDELRGAAIDLLAERAFLWTRDLPQNADEFAERLRRGRERVPSATQELTGFLTRLCEGYQAARLALEEAPESQWPEAVADARQQLELLTASGFLVETPWQWLAELPRYLRAIGRRFEKLPAGGLARDRRNLTDLKPLVELWVERSRQHNEQGVYDPELYTYRWMLEELRVSLFAQDLGTSMSISPQRMRKQWAKVS